MSKLPLNSIRPFVNNARVLRIAGTLLAALIISSCEDYPTPYQPGLYPRAAPAGWWDDEGASGKPRIIVHIGEQKAYFYKGKTLVGETTVSTGKPGFSTPPGRYTVLSKNADHVSSLFGDYVDDYGNVVRSNIDSRKDARPKGSYFDGARMPYAMFFRGGYAMHQGYVPPFAASHGCIRLPGQMAARFFENAPVGTSVTVTE
jgi:lipoprotein-anchoring transpeptidase ErfK/SrfK